MVDSADSPQVSTTATIIKRRRHRKLIVAGLVGAVVALVALCAGIAMVLADSFRQDVTSEAQALAPGNLTFEADATGYTLFLDKGYSTEAEGPRVPDVSRLHCVVEFADGSTKEIDGSRSSTVGTSFGTSFGSFLAVAGTTTVTCQWDEGLDWRRRFSVSKSDSIFKTLSSASFAVALAAAVLAAVSLFFGIRGKAYHVPV